MKSIPVFGGFMALIGLCMPSLTPTLSVQSVEMVAPINPPRPNILWISCEDMSPRLGCYGDSTVPTPNIDQLARESVRFANAFCTAGVCAPSRNAIITGMYQTSTGGHNMRTLQNTYPEKTGLPRQYSAVMPPQVRAFPEYLRAADYYTVNNQKTDYQFEEPPTVWDDVSYAAHWRKRPAGKPFFAVFNSTVTHESQVWVRDSLPLRANPDRVVLPPYYPDTRTVRHDVARHYSNIRDMDDWVGTLLAQLKADGLLDQTIIFFWSDHGDGLPFVKREINDRGLRVPLLIRFPDGRMAGSTRTDLVSMIDLAPTVLAMAGLRSPAHMQGRPIFGAERTRNPRRYVFAARDRLDSEYDRVRSVHDGRYQYIRNFHPEKPNYMDIAYRKQQPSMRELLRLRDEGKLNATQQRWFALTKPAEELYDLTNDPHQLTNLANAPTHQAHLLRFRRELDSWLKKTNDLGSIPEKELIGRWWNGGNVPPQTAAPQITVSGNKATIRCATDGASIGYQLETEPGTWRVYNGPVQVRPGQRVRVVAQRIGYVRSKEVSQ